MRPKVVGWIVLAPITLAVLLSLLHLQVLAQWVFVVWFIAVGCLGNMQSKAT